MNAYLVLARRELGGYFASLSGYVVMAAVLWLLGLSFTLVLKALSTEAMDAPITEVFYRTFYFWVILLLTAPVITMRTFAQEKSTGTYETLLTAPVSDAQVVLAKFTGAMAFYTALWLPMLLCVWGVHRYTSEPGALDLGSLGSTFLGIELLGALYVGLGCLASALSRSQIVAATLSFTMGLGLFMLSFVTLVTPNLQGWQGQLMAQLSVLDHMQEFSRGIVDTRHVMFHGSLSVLLVFLTIKSVESRAWK